MCSGCVRGNYSEQTSHPKGKQGPGHTGSFPPRDAALSPLFSLQLTCTCSMIDLRVCPLTLPLVGAGIEHHLLFQPSLETHWLVPGSLYLLFEWPSQQNHSRQLTFIHMPYRLGNSSTNTTYLETASQK